MRRYAVLLCSGLLWVQTANAQNVWLDRLFGWDSGVAEEDASDYVPFPGIPRDGLAPDTVFSPPLDGPISDLTGRWEIRVARLSDCTLNGFATLRRLSEVEDDYACELTIRDYCPGSHDGVIRQSCQLDMSGSGIYVASQVLESLNGATLNGYSPDNFQLWLAEDGSLIGNLDSYSAYDAQWTRAVGATS